MLKKYINYSFLTKLLLLTLYSFFVSFIFLSYNDVILRKILYTTSLLLLLIILRNINRILYISFVFFTAIISVFVFPVHVIYGELNYMYISSIFYTDYSEVISYMKLITPQTYIICVFIVLFSFIICLIDKLWENSKLNIVLLIILLFFPIKKIIAKKSQGKPENYFNTLPIKTFVKVSFWLYDINEKFELLKVEAKKPSTWQITENILPKTEIVVLIVGESLRKDFLHSYGFPINNTPFIDSSPHIKFNNYISVASTTSNSLSKTLALSRNLVNYEPYNNIVTLAKKIGYKSYWISSQEPISGHGSPIAQIALNTDEYFFMNNETTRKNDKDLFKNYLAISNNKSSPKFIVLHMIGSHPAIGDRVEYQYDEYLVSKEISYYNKSVKNTDAFLGQIYQNLKSTK